MRTTGRNLLLTIGTLLTLSGGAAAHAQLINIGTASNFAGLDLTSSLFTISKSTTLVSGNLGDASNGNFSFTGGGTVNGTLYAGYDAGLTITGGSDITGGVVQATSPSTPGNLSVADQAAQDATTAASYYAGLTPNQTLASISGGTFTGSGGQNVIDVTGNVGLSRTTLTLTGTASDTFIFNIDGTFNLSRSDVVLNGINPDQVLFNLIGTGSKVVTSGDSDTAGIFLAANGSIDIQGGVHDSDFIAGNTLTWESGVTITQATALAVQPVPELSTTLMAIGGGGLILALAGLKSRDKRRTLAV